MYLHNPATCSEIIDELSVTVGNKVYTDICRTNLILNRIDRVQLLPPPNFTYGWKLIFIGNMETAVGTQILNAMQKRPLYLQTSSQTFHSSVNIS
jgi:hypothetical protein